MFTYINSPASSPTLSASSGEPDYPTHGLPLWGRYPSFTPLQDTPGAWSPLQAAQVVPDTWITKTPSPASSEQYTDDCKYPPYVLEQMDNSQHPSEPVVYYDSFSSLRFRQDQLAEMVDGFTARMNDKQKAQEKVIERLQEMVDKKGEHWQRVQVALPLLLVKVCELKSMMEAQERKLKAQERKLKVHESHVRKRYNTRSGKN